MLNCKIKQTLAWPYPLQVPLDNNSNAVYKQGTVVSNAARRSTLNNLIVVK